eukprot:PhF_6_TR1440/c0_g1_i1/m.2553
MDVAAALEDITETITKAIKAISKETNPDNLPEDVLWFAAVSPGTPHFRVLQNIVGNIPSGERKQILVQHFRNTTAHNMVWAQGIASYAVTLKAIRTIGPMDGLKGNSTDPVEVFVESLVEKCTASPSFVLEAFASSSTDGIHNVGPLKRGREAATSQRGKKWIFRSRDAVGSRWTQCCEYDSTLLDLMSAFRNDTTTNVGVKAPPSPSSLYTEGGGHSGDLMNDELRSKQSVYQMSTVRGVVKGRSVSFNGEMIRIGEEQSSQTCYDVLKTNEARNCEV